MRPRPPGLPRLAAPFLLLALAACEHSPAPTPAPATSPTSTPTATPTATTPPAAGDDRFDTAAGPLTIHPVQHATLWFEVGARIVWVDPWSKARLDGPRADVILVTDIHGDHFDEAGIAAVRKPDTLVIAPKVVADELPGALALANGERKDLGFIGLEAVPMYNIQRGPEAGKLYHDRGRGNGYVITVGDKRLYISGDTECTPEMRALEKIDLAFVCMNLPYTMPPAEAGACVAAFKPKVLYPYHYRDSNLAELQQALAGTGVDLRLRNWYPAP